MANPCAKEEQVFFEEEEEEELTSDDDSDGDPTFDLLHEKFSSMSLKKSRHRVPKKMDTDSEEEMDASEVEVPELNEKDGKCFKEVESLIKGGQLGKLKVEQCKVYLRKQGLRLTGKKDVLLGRIREHLEIKDGEGEKKYPVSSFVINCKGDACTGDVVMFEQKVYELFSVASRSATGPPLGTRTVAGRIVKESYGAAKQQHTFTIEVLWSKGEKPLPPLHPLLIKGRNLYRLKTLRQKWADEEERRKILQEKHMRGHVARCSREVRLHEKEIRNLNRMTKNKSHINVIPHQKSQHSNCQIKQGSILKESVQSQPRHTKDINIQPLTQIGVLQLPCNGGMMDPTNKRKTMSQVQVNIPQGQGVHGSNSSISFTVHQNVQQVIQNGILRGSEHDNCSYMATTDSQRVEPVRQGTDHFSGIIDIYSHDKVTKAQRNHHLHIGKQQCSNGILRSSDMHDNNSNYAAPTRNKFSGIMDIDCRAQEMKAQGKHFYYSQHTASNDHIYRKPVGFVLPPQSHSSILKFPMSHRLPVERQVCRYYRQGRCRFYENCKFLHEKIYDYDERKYI